MPSLWPFCWRSFRRPARYALKSAATAARAVDFVHDVQPILRRNCFRCHGSKQQEGGLQLNRRESVYGSADSGEPIIVREHAADSLLIKRLVDTSYGDLMPLDGGRLAKREVDVLRRWIDQGARWPDELAEATHWAYQPIARPRVPDVEHPAADATPIDFFILRRLEQAGLEPMPPADRPQWIRRVSLALIGLPPTPAEVDAFVNDASPDAYEKVVDRLLASQRYGERWAVPWLDLARYADSNGFQADQIRDNWAYRDWVIRALNADMPFDQFVIDQLAGDLLPGATVDQRIATGFNRMTPCNVEAGVHPEANRVNQVVDRVNTTATVFLGTTLECGQCHDHKYDPFTQQDYYRFFAYFNNTPLEVKNTSGVTWDFYGPTMDLPRDKASQRRYDELQGQLADLKGRRKAAVRASEAEYQQWLATVRESSRQPVAWQPVVPERFETTGGETFAVLDDGAVLLSGSVPDTVEHVFTLAPQTGPITAIKLDVLTDESIPGNGPGRGDAKRSNFILSEIIVERVTDDGATPLALQDAAADFSQDNWDVARALDGRRKTGWAIAPEFGKPHWATFTLAQPLTLEHPTDRLRVTLAQYYGRGRVIGKPRISVCTSDPSLLKVDETIRQLAAKETLTAQETKQLRAAFEDESPPLRKLGEQIAGVTKQISQLKPDTTLVMVEMDQPRETFVLTRGDYDQPGEKVEPGTPAALPPHAIEPTGDRLELARWLTSPENPLLARVTVNRWWGQLFGTPIVSTPEDFGTQGEAPSHPQLLDWLAAELIDSGWSMKHVHKQIVTSAAFRRGSRITPELLEVDPDNRLLARGPRFRLAAELVRDNALAISGLLSSDMYGPPVMPYQPENLWRSVGRNQPKWQAAADDDRFRRGLYVIWKRAAPYPSFMNFDAPDRGTCTVNRPRTNTPLQALTLLNDPAYAEMALALADRVLAGAPEPTDEARIDYALRLAVSRHATSAETELLKKLLAEERETLAADSQMVAARTKPAIAGMKLQTQDKTELAAWCAVANVLLNLDETMTQ